MMNVSINLRDKLQKANKEIIEQLINEFNIAMEQIKKDEGVLLRVTDNLSNEVYKSPPNYEQKYLKYKQKYLELKNQLNN